MPTLFAPHRFAWTRHLILVLKTAILNLLVLWYATLPSGPINDVASAWQLQGFATWPWLTALSTAAFAGVMASRLIRRFWLGPVIAVITFVVVATGWLAIRPKGVAWPDLLQMAKILLALAGWSFIAIAVAVSLRRWTAPFLRPRNGVQAAVAGVAGIVTGLVVLLHPHALGPLLEGFRVIWPRDSAMPYDVLLTLYYLLGGFAAGFTVKLLWPSNRPLSQAPAFALTGCWCALAARTLLDSEDSPLWASDLTTSTLPATVLLIPVAIAVLVGLWLARWPARWSRDA